MAQVQSGETTAPPVPHTRWRRAAGISSAGRRAIKVFAAAVLLSALAVLCLGWFTGFRQVAHGALLSVAVAALLPLVIVAAGFALLAVTMGISVLGALIASDAPEPTDGGLVEMGISAAPGYYRFLFARFVAARRHPVFWGVPVGVLLGGLVLWSTLAAVVLPGESRTVQSLAGVQALIEETYQRTSRYPTPTADGHLILASLYPDAEQAANSELNSVDGVVADGFGRPLEYAKTGHWKLASYRLRSYGFDGKPGRDDLCVSGATKLARMAEAARDLSRLLAEVRKKESTVADRLEGVRALRCDD